MLYILITQFAYLVVWAMVFAGGVILLRRGQTNIAMPILFGSGILILIQGLYITTMVLTQAGAIDAVAGARMYRVMWVPQVLGAFLFALGFLQLARTTRRET